ncbi:TonB-dependent siderophore receptor [Steroidobacter sp.]|uniref:TonB-dependent siderophore receptor n=1 Tax=Steroidobacter sp. TaxID=1978227 RepID=UPI001A5833B8|nr:TonB-dependent receptor [Steroidobacter sp.]MBL8271404.1 TonB-dependent siderophore receptor [Steroidobacter sp.]
MTIVRSAGRHLGAISAVVAACASVLPSTVSAAASTEINFNQRVTFDIPAQPLQSALMQFAAQANVELSASTDLVEGKRAAAVKGVHSMEDALRTLLAGTGLRFMATRDGSVAIVPEVPTTADIAGSIETVNVFGTLDNELSVGSKSGQSLRETPKSVTIVTRERIEAQNLTSMAEALEQTTGVTVVSHSPTAVDSFFYSRGFRVQTLQLDGGAPAYTGGLGSFLAPDTAAYERVEMLRGVDGMFTGASQPGGVVNLVRKRAKATPAVSASLSAGSWEAYRGELDLTGPLTDDGRLRGRIVGAYSDKGYFYDRGHSEKTLFFGTAEYDITPSTLLIAGASYERRKEDAFFTQGHPRYFDGTDLKLSRSTAFNPDWAHRYSKNKEVFARLEQKYGSDGVLRLNLTRLDQEGESRTFLALGYLSPITLTGVNASSGASDYQSVQDLMDLSASGTFSLFGGSHRYTVGTDFAKVDAAGQKDYRLYPYLVLADPSPDNVPVDVFNFDPASYPEPDATLVAYYPENGQRQNGVYGALELELAAPLRLSLGGRYGKYRYLQIYQPVAADGTYGAKSRTRYNDSKFIPSVALRWDFAANWSAYASYAETFEVQASRLQGPLPGTPLDPITGAGSELGVKGEVLDFLNTSFAIFSVSRNGQAVLDPFYTAASGADGSRCCYLRQADVKVEGIDVEASGTVLPGWQMFAGYTYATADYKMLSFALPNGQMVPSGVAYALTRAPQHLFKLWTTWQLPGEYSRWTFNAGVRAYSETSATTAAREAPGSTVPVAFRAVQDPYALWNASVQYRINDTWSAGLYGDNLADTKYYQVLGGPTENTYGSPRSFVLTVRGHW